MRVSYNPKIGLIINFLNELQDYRDNVFNPQNARNEINILPHRILKELNVNGIDKPKKQSQKSVNYMA